MTDGRRPGRARRVVAAGTRGSSQLPADERPGPAPQSAPTGRAADDGDVGWGRDALDDGLDDAAARLLRERPPHWG